MTKRRLPTFYLRNAFGSAARLRMGSAASRSRRPLLMAWLAALFIVLVPQAVIAQTETTFGQPSVEAALGEPLTFTSSIAQVEGGTVDVLVRLVGHEPNIVIPAQSAGSDTWQATAAINVQFSAACSCIADGQSQPNTRFEYQFRVTTPDGATTLGPVGEGIVSDERFTWRTLEEDLVRVHWYEGDEGLAQSALDTANEAIDRASELLGSTLPAPVDLFIYATEEAMRDAVSPNRENVAGEAHTLIRTMFVIIPPGSASDFDRVLVAHELTHLVFDEATANDYHAPPRWLDEGVAVYLSEGYSAEWRFAVQAAVADESIIPLQGLGSLFPSPPDQFLLAYGESVSAVDFFVTTYGEQTLWDLIRSYADGLSNDDAFVNATGGDLAAFNEAWMGSLNLDVRPPLGPQPAAPGPVPPGWQTDGQPTAAPTAAITPPGSGVPTDSPVSPLPTGTRPVDGATAPPPVVPANPGTGAGDGMRSLVLVLIVVVAVVLTVLVLVLILQRGGARPPHPPV